VWCENGVSPNTPLAVDFHFYSANIANGERLAAALREAGFTVSTRTTRTLLIFKGLSIEATQRSLWTLDDLRTRVTEFVGLAQRLGTTFDGLGAEMP
jgi:hypothetical protein